MSAIKNLRILDFSTLLPGPYATMVLADMGAEVLRIESPSRPDICREVPPMDKGVSTKQAFLNRNKRCITLDLKVPEAAALIKDLVKEYDIVIEQFRPGVMDRLGLGYKDLKAANPKLIYCAITGYGQTGPFRLRAGHDGNFLSVAGINDYSRRKGERPPVMGIQIGDLVGGSNQAVIALLAAVNYRNQSGEGQYIDVSMTDGAFAMNAMAGGDYLAAGQKTGPESSWLNGGTFCDSYETADGRYLSVNSVEPQFFLPFCLTLGGEGLLAQGSQQDPESQADFKRSIAEKIKRKTLKEWAEIFSSLDACVEPVLTFAEACEHEQILARDMIVEVPTPGGGMMRQIASPFNLSACPIEYHITGGELGEYNNEFIENLSLNDTEKRQLRESGAFGKGV